MTHTEAREHLPRRSFLAGAIAVAGSAVAGGLVVAAAPGAVAATGADVTWRITSEPGDGNDGAQRTYAAMLNGIRAAVSSHRVRPDNGRPVSVTDQDGTSQFISVDLHAEDRPEFVRLFLRRSDTYFLGWRQGTEDGGGNVSWGNFFTLSASVTLPGSTQANTNRRFDGLESYSALSQQPLNASRTGMRISPSSLSNAVLQLQGGDQIAPTTAASAILQMIVGVAEASRFRNQAAATASAFRDGQAYAVTGQDIDQHNDWARMSGILLGAIVAGVVAFPEITIGGAVYSSAVALAAVLMLAHHSGKNTKGRFNLEGSTRLVAPDGTGDYWTVQAAVNAVPSWGANTIFIDKGTYNETVSVPNGKSWLTIQGVSGDRGDVVIQGNKCHGMTNPATGAQYGTQGSAVASFTAPNLTVRDLTISNTFDRNAHPEISPYETQAVAVAAMGDRQVYKNVAILSHQDTLLVKATTPTTQTRQYFVNCFIRGDVDFIFGNATAVIDRCQIQQLYWPGGTVLAPNTDYRFTYGILITQSDIFPDGQAPPRSMYLGRPWRSSPEAWPQAVVRDSVLYPQVTDNHPWTDMTPDYSWQWARFREYHNSGLGAGNGPDAPKLTDTEALEYTAQKYLAGTDGWNPVL